MKYLSVIEDKVYLLWQQEVQIKNLEELGELSKLAVVILYTGDKPSAYAASVGEQCEAYFFKTPEIHKEYTPMNKPYGVMKYLQTTGEEHNIMLIDSDVIFASPQRTEEFTDPSGWYMSDCEGYLGMDYLLKHLSRPQIEQMFSAAGLSLDLNQDEYAGAGAQYFFKNINAEDAEEVYNLCLPLYNLLKSFDTKLQVWTAEMWAWLFTGIKKGYRLYKSSALDFCWATDPAIMWSRKNILHLAGVTSTEMGHFYKGFYTRQQPWVKMDFSYITNRNSCSWLYFMKMKEYFDIQE